MRFLHCSDLHLGRRLCELDLFEDQQYILNQLVSIALAEGANAVLVAGDVYDKGIPSLAAVNLLDGFLTQLRQNNIPVYLISGNHDSADRLAFGGRLLAGAGVHLASVFGGGLAHWQLQDDQGPLHLWALPFVRPGAVRAAFPDAAIETYTDAVKTVVAAAGVNPSHRNLLMAHQFVTCGGASPELSESETRNLGTLDNVEAAAFEPFDYVALGHIHMPQQVGRDTLRYCGSPLVYSASEVRRPKTVTLVELGAKGEVWQRQLPLSPLRAVRKLQGPLEALLQSAQPGSDYVYALLTDDIPPMDAAARLRAVYPNLARIEFDLSLRAGGASGGPTPEELTLRSPAQLFADFYQQVHGRPLDQQQAAFLEAALQKEGEA